ncbi:2-C-methyl-D-erythritol 2,4-cyclodiphosphate synthase [Beggiatoa leptomitoformis]|uniref:2-C-methyl-D-erythritol 2,4-cyclodiphosphate synthase n=1 Tax=Beggiatoa leptomitoformis TaxID=288004 RepID=A0A2N9YJP1_9GAMM|nr:2-C-methyl-D-erythritol 2,4-cyclodiphosphate synthase [Beggiatoa leptomitoformis]AUI70683.1 2-C-methyl-D-erythritol 2,4-cyclodiphosphate synthase [Beggiatoa leptomitoformis]
MKTGLGQDSHRFVLADEQKTLLLGGVVFPDELGLAGNSDADVVLHAITNGISGITGVNILGKISDDLCLQQGITDSRVYLQEALKYLHGWQICHISISIECRTPKITPRIPEMKQQIAALLQITTTDVGITATTGEGLTDFGRGLGIQVFCIVTAIQA